MWMAWLRRRFPRSDSRQVFRFPEDTSIGAVPLQAANRSRLANRVTSVTSPMTVPALTGPMPKTSVTEVPEALTAAASFFLVSRSWASRRRRSARNSAASSWRASSTAPDGVTCSRTRVA
jgi:hypothetical protein